jgi:2-dehydro-3-deoxygalactonokinase
MKPLIALDWGTSSLRGARLNAEGRPLEERAFPRGILTVAPGGFAALFDELFGDWMQAPGSLCLVSGMAGSRQGWLEAPYCPCPAGFDDLGRHLAWVDPGPRQHRVAIVPGLSTVNDAVPDVMRGEEVQIFGALRLAGAQDGLLVLPGTHSKWATVQAGRVTGFRSFMTGEVYALLSQHSILARTLDTGAPLDPAAFRAGVLRAQHGPGLLHHAFGARTLSLFDRMPASALASYLSGLVIGEELRAQALPAGDAQPILLIGSDTLTDRYASALTALGAPSRAFGAQATWAGLHAVAQGLPGIPP